MASRTEYYLFAPVCLICEGPSAHDGACINEDCENYDEEVYEGFKKHGYEYLHYVQEDADEHTT